MPWRDEIVRGLLGADLVGFQRPAARRTSCASPATWLGADVTARCDPARRSTAARCGPARSRSPSTSAEMRRWPATRRAGARRGDPRGARQPRRVILGVDRLDYTKGIDVRLKAFGELLAEGRLTRDDTVLVQVAAPSRERVEQLPRAARRRRAAGRPDQRRVRHGRAARGALPAPALPRDELVAFYLAADVMAGHAAARRHEPGRQGVRRCRVDGGGCCWCSASSPAPPASCGPGLLVNPYDTGGVKETTCGRRDNAGRWRRAGGCGHASAGAHPRRGPLGRSVPVRPANTGDHVADAMGRMPERGRGATAPGPETERLLVATDFDGCLAPIVGTRPAAPLPAAMEALSMAVVAGHPRRGGLGPGAGGPGYAGGPPRPDPGGQPRRRDVERPEDRPAPRGAAAAAAAGAAADQPTGSGARLEPKPGAWWFTPAGRHAMTRPGDQAVRGEPGDLAGSAPAAGKKVLELTVVTSQQGPRD